MVFILMKCVKNALNTKNNLMSKVWYSDISEATINVLKKLIDYSELSKKKVVKIFDFGCGNGRYMYIFKEFFPKAQIYGADINEKNINSLKADFKNVFILNSNKMSLNYEENFFDLVFSSNVIEHIPHNQYVEYLYEIQKILKPNCKFIFGTPNYPYKRFYDMRKSLVALIKFNFHDFKYYLLDDPTHINPLNYKKLETDFKMFSKLELKPTKIFLRKIIKNKKFSDKINGIAIK